MIYKKRHNPRKNKDKKDNKPSFGWQYAPWSDKDDIARTIRSYADVANITGSGYRRHSASDELPNNYDRFNSDTSAYGT
jgi:hypothetical protein